MSSESHQHVLQSDVSRDASQHAIHCDCETGGSLREYMAHERGYRDYYSIMPLGDIGASVPLDSEW